MDFPFVRAFHSEWLKRKRSFASALVIGGALFTPAIVAVVRLIHFRTLAGVYAAPAFWADLWRSSWESMAIFFLPLGAILATSLIAQIEFRSNAWKQVHALPLSAHVLFLSKLSVILVMLVEFLALFSLGIWLSAMIPYVLVPNVPRLTSTFFSLPLLRENALYFLDCLPIVAAQYLMSLRANNVLVPIGVGFLAWVGALAAVSSRYAIWWPYAYTIVHYLQDKPKGAAFGASTRFHWLAALAFVLLTIASYTSFVTKSEKG
ncbi:MAG: ABC transporter permease [Acidobacteria bacterium]|nr:ABC transporter permease [Acidobacteriota bacterium]MBV9478580.1 ABC transporter permease [Acidobacteriota bacterium]